MESVLAPFDAVWCVPGSPYADMEGALAGIRYTRTRPMPFFGSCGGFQHALIEFYRDVLGLAEADHAESNPEAGMPLIAPLVCSLVGKTGTVRFEPGSRIGAIYGEEEALEPYHCSYGINPAYLSALEGSDLRIGARDEQGEIRAVELSGHPFFLATLYQPERSALEGRTHPLIVEYVRAALTAHGQLA
jgi:CTP synthase (UTP-ammonia lyase)